MTVDTREGVFCVVITSPPGRQRRITLSTLDLFVVSDSRPLELQMNVKCYYTHTPGCYITVNVICYLLFVFRDLLLQQIPLRVINCVSIRNASVSLCGFKTQTDKTRQDARRLRLNTTPFVCLSVCRYLSVSVCLCVCVQ